MNTLTSTTEALSCTLCIARLAWDIALAAEACTLETTELADDDTLEALLDAAAIDCEALCCAFWIA
jgi:hypothetical protein